MAVLILTDSGSSYSLENGRLTRYSSHDIVGAPSGLEIEREPVRVVRPPVIGCFARFQFKDDRLASHCGGVITTSTVTDIIPVVDVPIVPA